MEQKIDSSEGNNDDIIVIDVKQKVRPGPKNKRKGSRVEREYANFFKNFDESLKHCKTTRNTSKLLDNCKIDLNFLPVLVQIKAGEQRGLNPALVLSQITDSLRTNIPEGYPEHSMPKIVVHHKDIPKGRRNRVAEDTIVTMTFEDFLIFFAAFLKQKQDDLQTRQTKN